MQQILTNGKIFVNDKEKQIAEAMMINDGAVVLSSSKKEILDLKTKETIIDDLNEKYVFPCMFGIGLNVFKIIDTKIKSAETYKNNENFNKNDENYENFYMYDEYKNEFVEYQNQLIKNGITTISEFDVDKNGFVFYKKLAEDNVLKIDVALYVNLITSKKVVDENCVTYRKYRNHLRIGGYYLKIDGEIQDLKAWLSKRYSGTMSHFGAGEIVGEQLYFVVKNAVDEKKQIVFDASGDKAVCEILNVFDEINLKDKIDNFYRPVILGAELILPKFYERLKKYDATICFKDVSADTEKLSKKFVGFFRKKWCRNYFDLIKNNIKFVFQTNFNGDFNINFYVNHIYKKRKTISKICKNKQLYLNYINNLCGIIYNNTSNIFFDSETKGSIETQKQVNFFATDKNIFDLLDENYKISSVYLNEEKTEY